MVSPEFCIQHFTYDSDDEGWYGCAFNYRFQIIQSRIAYFIYGTDKEGIEKIYLDIMRREGISSWSRWSEMIDGQTYHYVELYETRLVDVPEGYIYHFPLKDVLGDDPLYEVLLDPGIDDYIRDILIYFNLLGIKTISSCSGLLEEHIDDTKEESYPFIMFIDKEYSELVLKIIVDTDWELDTDWVEPVIILNSEDDDYIKEQWNILRGRLKMLVLLAYKNEMESLPKPLATKNWWIPKYGLGILY